MAPFSQMLEPPQNSGRFTLSEIIDEDSDVESNRANRRSFEMVADGGEVIGYIRTWHDQDDYSGFVYFDAQCNIIDWKAFPETPGSMHFN